MIRSQAELKAEIHKIIEDGLDAGDAVAPDWVVRDIVGRHTRIYGEDYDFYFLCANGFVRENVRHTVQKYKEDPRGTPEQLTLPDSNFGKIQTNYLTNRNGEQVIVRIERLTEDELIRKEAELRSMSAGCISHANEIRRYRLEHFRNVA